MTGVSLSHVSPDTPVAGKQRSKLEAALNTNRPSPGGHERKIVTKLRNAERNKRARGGRTKQVGN